MQRRIIVKRVTQAYSCGSLAEAAELRERAAATWPDAVLQIQNLKMFPRDLWFVQAWRADGCLDGYVWEYQTA